MFGADFAILVAVAVIETCLAHAALRLCPEPTASSRAGQMAIRASSDQLRLFSSIQRNLADVQKSTFRSSRSNGWRCNDAGNCQAAPHSSVDWARAAIWHCQHAAVKFLNRPPARRGRGRRLFSRKYRFGIRVGSVRIGVRTGGDACSEKGASIATRKARPASVICQPALSRKTNAWLKMSSPGARATSRMVRFVQSDPLEIKMLTQRVRSATGRRPPGCPANTFNTVI